jgi:hypothetical protein
MYDPNNQEQYISVLLLSRFEVHLVDEKHYCDKTKLPMNIPFLDNQDKLSSQATATVNACFMIQVLHHSILCPNPG